MSAEMAQNDSKQDGGTAVLYTSENKNTGTRHVLSGEVGNPICGVPACWQGVSDASPMLGAFPEDFGTIPKDCERCASRDVEEHVVEADL